MNSHLIKKTNLNLVKMSIKNFNITRLLNKIEKR